MERGKVKIIFSIRFSKFYFKNENSDVAFEIKFHKNEIPINKITILHVVKIKAFYYVRRHLNKSRACQSHFIKGSKIRRQI